MHDSSLNIEITRLQRTLRATEDRLSELPPQCDEALPNALLILAVQRMLKRDGVSVTATVLCRLADAVRHGPPPPASRAIDLTSLQS
ncbi:MAG: hypothetical protein WDO68_07280 [Gammaproteobacteria bacterium]